MPRVRVISDNGTELETELSVGKNVVQYANDIIGWVQPIMLPTDQVMLVDEDGRPKGLPINKKATELARVQVLGKVIICNIRLLD